jgi:hypothetical protein
VKCQSCDLMQKTSMNFAMSFGVVNLKP